MAIAMEETKLAGDHLDISQPAKQPYHISFQRSNPIPDFTSFSSRVNHFHARFSNGDVNSDDL